MHLQFMAKDKIGIILKDATYNPGYDKSGNLCRSNLSVIYSINKAKPN